VVNVQAGGELEGAYAACARIAREHYENFPVASWLVPRSMRPHVAAVYAFARIADDFADEGSLPAAKRLALLDRWLRCLLDATGSPARPCRADDELPSESPQVFLALGNTIRDCGLQVSPFEDLLSAFRQDVTTARYSTWDDVLDYCRRSANPVGRIVLAIGGYRDERLNRSSDALCTALQLTNFWQDLARDWQKGRLYLPLDECEGAGADCGDLDAGRLTPAWLSVLRSASSRTLVLYDCGRAVCEGVGGRLGLELRLTWSGGRRVLERLEAANFDVFSARPKLGAGDVPVLAWRALAWRKRRSAS
jgi:squalene synthase HpnC